MNSAYLTLEEAKTLTGKSESTLRRLVKSCLLNKSQKKLIKKRKLKNGGYQYLIAQTILQDRYKLSTLNALGRKSPEKNKNKNANTIKEKGLAKDSNNESVTILKQYINTLEKQLEVKDTQINDKSKQINELLERDKESHLLLDRINEALIRYRIPEYIETQEITYTETDQSNHQTSEEKVLDLVEKNKSKKNKSKKNKSKKKKERATGRATFSDWLNDLNA